MLRNKFLSIVANSFGSGWRNVRNLDFIYFSWIHNFTQHDRKSRIAQIFLSGSLSCWLYFFVTSLSSWPTSPKVLVFDCLRYLKSNLKMIPPESALIRRSSSVITFGKKIRKRFLLKKSVFLFPDAKNKIIAI